jgi:hypothetical protein
VEVSARLRSPRPAPVMLALAFAVLAAFSIGALFLAAKASAAQAPSNADDFSAADQYVESVPTAGGPKVPGVGGGGKAGSKAGSHVKDKSDSPAKLSPAVKSRLAQEPAQTAVQLERIATSTDYGAPSGKLRKVDVKSSSVRVPQATVSAAGNDEQDTLTWLIVALVATTVLTVGTAGYRRYRSRNSAAD